MYLMNHGYYSVFNKYATLVPGHAKFATDKTSRQLGLRFISGKFPLTLDSGRIFVEYTY